MGIGLKRKRFFHFREKQQLSGSEQIFAKFRLAKFVVFAEVFLSAQVFAQKGKFLQ
jgi:hypothetical protein